MGEMLDHYLVIAMVIAETFRGVREIRDFISRQRAEHDPDEARSRVARLLRRHRPRIDFAYVGGLALIPTLYYGEHAVPWVATTMALN